VSKPDPRATPEPPLFRRLAETGRETVALVVDGRPVEALAGDSLLTALLANGARLRVNEFDGRPRAGFCLMGACQDCWVRLEDGRSLRACATPVAEGMRVLTGAAAPDGTTTR